MNLKHLLIISTCILSSFFLGGCDPVELGNSYEYVVDGPGFVTTIIRNEQGEITEEISISAIHIVSIEKEISVNENPYLIVRTTNNGYHKLYEISTKDFIVLVAQALGPWVTELPIGEFE